MADGDDDRYEVQYVVPVYKNWGNDNNGNREGGAAN